MAGQAECFGREAPLAALDAFLDGVGRGPSALVVEGDTGIGKTTVWTAGVELAETRGCSVFPSRPI
ncbi:MAG: ATP-binding protein, partial [Acidimicrobiia bacterium]